MLRLVSFRVLVFITVVGVTFVASPSVIATLPPPPVRLALMFDRTPWQEPMRLPLHAALEYLAERWES